MITVLLLFVLMQGTGIILGTIVLAAVSVVVAVIICFVSSWQLSFVLLLAFPLNILSYRLSYKLLQSSGAGEGKNLEMSTHLVTESVTNIKTVVSLGAQHYFVQSISSHLHSHMM